MDAYPRNVRRGIKVNPIGALLSLALGLCFALLCMGYAVGLHATDLNRFRAAVDTGLTQTGVLSADDAERFAQETIGYLTGRRATWLPAVSVGGELIPVPEAFAGHMAEVQRWTMAFRFMLPLMIAVFAALVFLTLIGAMAMRSRTFAPRSYLLGIAVPVLLAGGMFLWATMDFTSFWDVLHRALIPDGIFAADEPVMRLFPLALFEGYLAPVALTFLYCLAAALLIPAILMIVDQRVRRRRLEKQIPYQPMEYR